MRVICTMAMCQHVCSLVLGGVCRYATALLLIHVCEFRSIHDGILSSMCVVKQTVDHSNFYI